VTEVYTFTTTALFATASLYVLNASSVAAKINVWATTSVSPGAADKIVHQTEVPADGGQLSLDCRLFSGSEKIFVQSDQPSCVVRLEGIEKV
jgi:hypothetical protein